jgi:hypothetical protein
VVILQGSDFDMGFQYAQQVIQIFGPWLLQRKAGRSRRFSNEDLACLRRWEDQLREYAPLGAVTAWAARKSLFLKTA